MRIHNGMTVRFAGATDEQVNWGNTDDPRGVLEVGDVYKVDAVEEHNWHTKIYLADFPNLAFNSVCFEEAGCENG